MPAVNRRGDLWLLGGDKLICGDARGAGDYAVLLGEERADIVFTDLPYNVPIEGNVSGLGAIRHGEFAFTNGEMSKAEFTAFLTESLSAMAAVMAPPDGLFTRALGTAQLENTTRPAGH